MEIAYCGWSFNCHMLLGGNVSLQVVVWWVGLVLEEVQRYYLSQTSAIASVSVVSDAEILTFLVQANKMIPHTVEPLSVHPWKNTRSLLLFAVCTWRSSSGYIVFDGFSNLHSTHFLDWSLEVLAWWFMSLKIHRRHKCRRVYRSGSLCEASEGLSSVFHLYLLQKFWWTRGYFLWTWKHVVMWLRMPFFG